MSESSRSAEDRPGRSAELPLESLAFAAGLDATELELLHGALKREMLNATEVLFREGDRGDRLYLLARGKLAIVLRSAGGARCVMTYGPGAMLGEASLLEGARRPATATAAEDSVVYSLSRAALDSLATEHPAAVNKVLLNLGKHLSERLREAPNVLRKLSDSSG
jgi:CRP/FNR family cyclic AMP-dependent transcriptional regulator